MEWVGSDQGQNRSGLCGQKTGIDTAQAACAQAGTKITGTKNVQVRLGYAGMETRPQQCAGEGAAAAAIADDPMTKAACWFAIRKATPASQAWLL